MKPHKFRKGPGVTSPHIALTLILEGEWLYLGDDGRPKSPGFLRQMTLDTLVKLTKRRRLFIAIPNEEFDAV